MFTVCLSETENSFSTVLKRNAHVVFTGKGIGRTPRLALQAAKAALVADFRAKEKEFPGGGTPIFKERIIWKGMRKIERATDW